MSGRRASAGRSASGAARLRRSSRTSARPSERVRDRGAAVGDAAGADGLRPRGPRARHPRHRLARRGRRERGHPRHRAGRGGRRARVRVGGRTVRRSRTRRTTSTRRPTRSRTRSRCTPSPPPRSAESSRSAPRRSPRSRGPIRRWRPPYVREYLPGASGGDELMSTTDWVLIAIQGLVVIAFIAIGVRAGGIGLGLWGGVGTLVLVFVFGLDPGEPPISAILIIIAVISAAAAMPRRHRLHGHDRQQGAARATEGTQLRRALRRLRADDPHRDRQHVLLDHPGDQRGRVLEQDQARARPSPARRSPRPPASRRAPWPQPWRRSCRSSRSSTTTSSTSS